MADEEGRSYDPQKDAAAQEPLTANELKLVTRLFGDPFAFPLEFKAWLRGWLEEQFPRIGTLAIASTPVVTGAIQVATSIGALVTGDGASGLLRLGASPFRYVPVIYDGTLGKWVTPQNWSTSWGGYSWSHNTTVDYGYSSVFPLAGTEDYALLRAAGLTCQVRFLWAWYNDSNSSGDVWWDIAGSPEVGGLWAAGPANVSSANGGGQVPLTTGYQVTSHADTDEADWRSLAATWDAANNLFVQGRIHSNAAPSNTVTGVGFVRQLVRWVSS